MEILKVILTAFGSITVLFILSKLMGNREMSQLSMFDYINGITIGSIAAEMATTEFTDALKPLVAMIVYAIVIVILEFISRKTIKIRRIINGHSIILYDNGELYSKNLAKAKMDLNEFLTQCRINGYFDLSTIQTIILEPNGKFSILPIADSRPITGKDLNLKPTQDYLVANIIIDGTILTENLRHTGNNETWLNNQLRAHNITDIKDVFLATCDMNNTFHVYHKNNELNKKDVLE